MQTQAERREQPFRARFESAVSIVATRDEAKLSARATDLSDRGVRVVAQRALPVGTDVVCILLNENADLSMPGRVVWTRHEQADDAKRLPSMGIQFTDLPEPCRRELQRRIGKDVGAEQTNNCPRPARVWFERTAVPAEAEAAWTARGLVLSVKLPHLRPDAQVVVDLGDSFNGGAPESYTGLVRAVSLNHWLPVGPEDRNCGCQRVFPDPEAPAPGQVAGNYPGTGSLWGSPLDQDAALDQKAGTSEGGWQGPIWKEDPGPTLRVLVSATPAVVLAPAGALPLTPIEAEQELDQEDEWLHWSTWTRWPPPPPPSGLPDVCPEQPGAEPVARAQPGWIAEAAEKEDEREVVELVRRRPAPTPAARTDRAVGSLAWPGEESSEDACPVDDQSRSTGLAGAGPGCPPAGVAYDPLAKSSPLAAALAPGASEGGGRPGGEERGGEHGPLLHDPGLAEPPEKLESGERQETITPAELAERLHQDAIAAGLEHFPSVSTEDGAGMLSASDSHWTFGEGAGTLPGHSFPGPLFEDAPTGELPVARPRQRPGQIRLWLLALLMTGAALASAVQTDLWSRLRAHLTFLQGGKPEEPGPAGKLLAMPSGSTEQAPLRAVISADEAEILADRQLIEESAAGDSPVAGTRATGAATAPSAAAAAGPGAPACNRPHLAVNDTEVTLVVPLGGALSAPQHYLLAEPEGLAINLPGARALCEFGDYPINQRGFRLLWLRPRAAGGVHLRVFFSGRQIPQHRITSGSGKLHIIVPRFSSSFAGQRSTGARLGALPLSGPSAGTSPHPEAKALASAHESRQSGGRPEAGPLRAPPPGGADEDQTERADLLSGGSPRFQSDGNQTEELGPSPSSSPGPARDPDLADPGA